MIQFPANAQVFVMHEPISFHNGIDGTSAIAKLVLKKEPLDGAFFAFRNKRGHSLRLLFFDGGGFWLCTRRLCQGTYNKAWPKGEEPGSALLARELQVLIWGGDPRSVQFPALWRKVA
jgi:transposase